MTMTYTTNPHIARVRMQAVHMVRTGSSTRAAARHFGFDHSTVVRWVAKAEELRIKGSSRLETKSSRPHSHPRALDPALVAAIVSERRRTGRCAQIVQQSLHRQGIEVSLSSVKRTLERQGLLRKRGKWKRYRPPVPRPLVTSPGDLVQTDTIHFVCYRDQTRSYVYTSIDLYSRIAHAHFVRHISQRHSLAFILAAQRHAQFSFSTVQADNGPEFGKWFGDMLSSKDITLRHSRVHKPNDNAFIERFNRTLQDECLGRNPKPEYIPEMLKEYLEYYNSERLHLGINCQTPREVVQRS